MMRSTPIVVILIIAGFFTSNAREPQFGGYVEIDTNSLIVSKENFRKAALAKARNVNKKIRVLALVDSTFDPAVLGGFGWKFRAYITNDIVSVEGPEETAHYLTSIDGLKHAQIPFDINTCADDSVRKLSFLNEVYGTVSGNLPGTYSGKGVLVGILDTEYDTRHPAFLDSAGKSRFVAIWDQHDTTGPQAIYGYGTIKNQSQIEADSNFALSPEHIHGTMITGIAAGSKNGDIPYWGVAPEVSLIGVRYTKAGNDLVDGIRWIFKVADSLEMPCVINMSIGTHNGPHDGTSLIDRAIDSLSANGKIIVGAAGNDGYNRAHVQFILNRNETKSTWAQSAKYSAGGDRERTVATIDLWGKPGIYYAADFYLIDTTTMIYHQIQPSVTTNMSRQYTDTVFVTDSISKRTDTVYFYAIAERRSALNTKVHVQAQALSSNLNMMLGVRVKNTSSSQDTINIWNIQKRAFKSLGMAEYLDGDTIMSINEIGGTAKRNITVGSYVSSLDISLWDGTITGPAGYRHELSEYSSRGPTSDGRVKPDIIAPGCRIVCPQSRAGSDQNIVIWPDHNNTHGRYSYSEGTSFASPVVCGVVALMLQVKPTLSPEEVKQILQKTAYKDEYTGAITASNSTWGAGKLNALGAIQMLTGVTENRRVLEKNDNYFNVKMLKNSIVISGILKDKMLPEISWYTLNGKLVKKQLVQIDKVINLPEIAGNQMLILKVKALNLQKTFLIQKHK